MAWAFAGSQEVCDYAEEPVAVHVGYVKTRFTVSPSVLTKNSDFFKAALSGQWRESSSKSVTLANADPHSFNYYLHWANKGELDSIVKHLGDGERDELGYNRFRSLVNLYILADQVQDTRLRNAIMDQMTQLAKSGPNRPPMDSLTAAYDHLLAQHTLRRWLLDYALCGGLEVEYVVMNRKTYPEEFIDDLLMGWGKASKSDKAKPASPLQMPACTYHEHDDEVPLGQSCNGKRAAADVTPPDIPARKAKRSTRLNKRMEV